MLFDPDNHIIKLCAQGMDMEGAGKPEEARKFFEQAWNESTDDFEKFTSAHYVARQQASVSDKLKWDQTALYHAMQIDDPQLKGAYPSLYLNIAKCFEDLGDMENAKNHYELASSFTHHLPDDGYGHMIRGGIQNGLDRMK